MMGRDAKRGARAQEGAGTGAQADRTRRKNIGRNARGWGGVQNDGQGDCTLTFKTAGPVFVVIDLSKSIFAE